MDGFVKFHIQFSDALEQVPQQLLQAPVKWPCRCETTVCSRMLAQLILDCRYKPRCHFVRDFVSWWNRSQITFWVLSIDLSVLAKLIKGWRLNVGLLMHTLVTGRWEVYRCACRLRVSSDTLRIHWYFSGVRAWILSEISSYILYEPYAMSCLLLDFGMVFLCYMISWYCATAAQEKRGVCRVRLLHGSSQNWVNIHGHVFIFVTDFI